MNHVDVMLVPITKEEAGVMSEAAYTLHFLAELTGQQKHREQSNFVQKFAGRRGIWNADFAVKLPEPGDEK